MCLKGGEAATIGWSFDLDEHFSEFENTSFGLKQLITGSLNQ